MRRIVDGSGSAMTRTSPKSASPSRAALINRSQKCSKSSNPSGGVGQRQRDGEHPIPTLQQHPLDLDHDGQDDRIELGRHLVADHLLHHPAEDRCHHQRPQHRVVEVDPPPFRPDPEGLLV